MMTLRDRGLPIFDLGDLLKDVKETIYADDIHFIRDTKGDSKGYRLMATRQSSTIWLRPGICSRNPETEHPPRTYN